MAIKTKTTSTSASSSYVDFEPASDLVKEEGLETLIIHLPDFKKEQLRVQVNKDGVLRINGERPTNGNGTKRNRFVKETKVPEGCDVNEIRAKFINGRLNITMPKKVVTTPPAPQVIQDQKPKAEVTNDHQKPNGENGGIKQKLKGRSNKVALGFGIAVVSMVAIGAIVASKFGSESSSSPSMFSKE
ncbi:inactive protein RESTRICTED TEV MOVEMENT 2-like isoform X3 [Chenopodium quinoa]|uniref:SHSP domain-containing protein n=1 Tax=Chenopodium quinoa TaxID=63459 RepID=A0A803N3C1_CHEQI|nr:inactive protein RESTRICTED TEV MOVEMENT 2-like isoform X3 [Chenopodium quinoa]